MQVLVALRQADGGVVSREALNRRCWGGRAVSDDALDRTIAKLRRLLSEAAGDDVAIVTVPRIGFRLTARPADPAASPAVDPVVASGLRSRVLDRRAMIGGVATAAGAVALAGGYALFRQRHALAAAGPTLVAVLNFQNLNANADTAFLGSATSRQIRDQLSRIAGLRLIAEPSSRSVAARQLGWQEAGKRLGARYVIDGSVNESGTQVRIAATLVDVTNGATIWTDRFEGISGSLFALQDQVSGALLRELIGRIGLDASAAAPVRAEPDSRAFRLVLEGQDLLDASRTARMEGKNGIALDAADRAYRLAGQALAIDPRSVDALLLVAQLMRNGWTRAMADQDLTPDQRVTASIAFVTRALAIDPNDPAALTALGDYYRRYEWRWAEAETLFRKALAANPSFIEAHWSYGYMLGVLGRSVEGLRHAQAVFALDPETTWRRVALPRLLYLVGRREEAFARYAIELAATPGNIFLVTEIYLVRLTEGKADEIDALAVKVRALNGNRIPPALDDQLKHLAAAAAALRGERADFLARIDRDVADYDRQDRDTGKGRGRASVDLLYIFAMEYAWAGDRDKALALLRRALMAKSLYWPATLPYGNAPFPVAIRRDPRFGAIWSSSLALIDLLARRRTALQDRQMAGYGDDGRFTRPLART